MRHPSVHLLASILAWPLLSISSHAQTCVIAGDPDPIDQFGRVIASHSETAIVGAPQDGELAFFAGAAYAFRWTGSEWVQEAKLMASDGVTQDRFGIAVAVDGELCVVGASFSGAFDGAAYVLARTDQGWVEQAKLSPEPSLTGGLFGNAVAIWQDTVFVGAEGSDGNAENSGSVHVFERSGTSWQLTDVLLPTVAAEDRFFGRSLAVDGDRLVVGAWDLVTIFARSGNEWLEEEVLLPPSPNTFGFSQQFGLTVDVDDDRVIVSNSGFDGLGPNTGAAWLYEYDGSSWSSPLQLGPGTGPSQHSQFGGVVTIDDGVCVISNLGTAEVFAFDGSQWHNTSTIGPCFNLDFDSQIGVGIAIDDGRILVGAPASDLGADDAGAVIVTSVAETVPPFCEAASGPISCTKLGGLFLDQEDEFGSALAIDGTRAVVTAPASMGFAAVVYEDTNNGWVLSDTLVPTGLQGLDEFGSSVAISGDTIAVSAKYDSPPSFNLRAIVVFEKLNVGWAQGTILTWPGGNDGRIVIEGDTLAATAPGASEVHVFTREAGGWTLQQVLDNSSQQFTEFGRSGLDLSGDTLMVGDARAAGEVYIFERTNNQWIETQVFVPDLPTATGYFGKSLSVDGDHAAVVAALAIPDPLQGPVAGLIYFLERTDTGWVEQTRFGLPTGSHLEPNVVLKGNRCLFSEPRADGGGLLSGSGFLYERIGTSWQERFPVIAGDASASDAFGIAGDFDGDRILIGAPGDDDFRLDSGSVYAFDLAAELSSFCFADGLGCTLCPCGNNSAAGSTGGCINSAGQSARLSGSGQPSISADTLEFLMSGAPPDVVALLISGDNALPNQGPCPPGSGIQSTVLDGLRCVGGGLIRHGLRATDSAGTVGLTNDSWDDAIVVQAGFAAGQTRHFQVIYRDDSGQVCGTGANTTNGRTVVFWP